MFLICIHYHFDIPPWIQVQSIQLSAVDPMVNNWRILSNSAFTNFSPNSDKGLFTFLNASLFPIADYAFVDLIESTLWNIATVTILETEPNAQQIRKLELSDLIQLCFCKSIHFIVTVLVKESIAILVVVKILANNPFDLTEYMYKIVNSLPKKNKKFFTSLSLC